MLQPAAMPPAARPELDFAATCRNCGQALTAGRAVCPGCGAAHGAANRCPHCSAVADVERHRALGFRCLVCGGPRVAVDVQGVELGTTTNEALQSAGKEQTQHLVFSAAGFALVGMGALALLMATVAVLAASPSALLTAAIYAASAVPVLAGGFALSRAARARRRRTEALLRARVSALADVQAVTGELSADRVSEVLRVPPEVAELVLAEASVASYLNDAPAPRTRIDDLAGEPAGDSEAPSADAPPRRRTELE